MKIRNGITAFGLGLSLIACNQPVKDDVSQEEHLKDTVKEITEAEQLIAAAIKAHGGSKYNQAHYSFDFRKKHYSFKNEGVSYTYEMQEFNDEGKKLNHTLKDGNYELTIDGKKAEISEKEWNNNKNALNSVIYFVQIPHKLNDPAVNADYKGQSIIKDTAYQLVVITFDEENGGKDYQDEYLYWINENTHEIDYLAYSFIENDGGTRFRKAINKRKIDGILFQDYINYKGEKGMDLYLFAEEYEKGELEELSRIEIENVKAIE